MPKHISRRSVTKLLAAGAAEHAASVLSPASAVERGSLLVEGAQLEWQRRPLALDRLRPRFTWTLKAAGPAARGLQQTAFRISIRSAQGGAVLFDSGMVNSALQRYRPDRDLPLASQSRYIWQLQVWDQDKNPSPVSAHEFSTGLVKTADFAARWITADDDPLDTYRAVEGQWHWVEKPEVMPLFRKAFTVRERPVSAHVVVAGLGQYQLWLNGTRVSPEGLNGAWTNFDKQVLYDAYDVTALIGPGTQVLGAALGNGFFNVEAVKRRYTKLNTRYGQPRLWLQLRILYADGSQDVVATNSTWQARAGGTTYSSIFGGEDFDARRDNGAFSASEDWKPAEEAKGEVGPLQASTFRTSTVQEQLNPRAVTSPAPGVTVYDFAINHSGRPKIHLKNTRAGDVVRILPGELLLEDGTVDQQSMTGGKPGLNGIAFNYTCRGAKEELWQPQFTYTGYRYLQVEGVEAARIAGIQSLFMHAALDTAGRFTCSDRNMSAIHGLIRQALRSNTAGVLTDCPHREKLGWLEQTYLNAATAMNNLDVVRLYEKMTRDMRDAQEESGMVPSIAPEFVKFLRNGKSTDFRDSPEWSAALTLGSWYVYQRYGDLDILRDNYDAMLAHIAYLESRLEGDGLLDFGLGDWYDIGPGNPGRAQLTSRKMTATASFYAELDTTAKAAALLGKPGAARLRARAEALKQTMQRQLMDAEKSTFDTGSQTAQAMALVLDLFPEQHRARALEILVADICSRGNHVTAGDIGFHYVVRALTAFGRSDVLYDMLSRTDKPAYLEQIRNGATSLTEAWDGWRQSSQNHFMLGHAEIWFFEGLGGIQIDFSRQTGSPILIAPRPVAGIDSYEVAVNTVLGHVRCAVRREGSKRVVEISVPAGQTADIRLPFADASPAVLQAQSGDHRFVGPA
jgi:alpha-L-rhamnosidase